MPGSCWSECAPSLGMNNARLSTNHPLHLPLPPPHPLDLRPRPVRAILFHQIKLVLSININSPSLHNTVRDRAQDSLAKGRLGSRVLDRILHYTWHCMLRHKQKCPTGGDIELYKILEIQASETSEPTVLTGILLTIIIGSVFSRQRIINSQVGRLGWVEW